MTTATGLQLAITEPTVDAVYTVEASTNLVIWTKLMARTSAGDTFCFIDAGPRTTPSVLPGCGAVNGNPRGDDAL